MCNFFFKDRVGKPIYMHLLLKIKVFPQNMGIGLDKKNKKNIFFHFGGSIRTPPTWGPPKNRKNLSTLGLYCIVNKTMSNFLLITIQEPLTRPFQNTPYFSQSDNFSIFDGCPKFRNFQNFIV